MVTSTTFESSTAAAMSWAPDIGDISGAEEAIFIATAHPEITLSTSSDGWSELGSRARVRQQTNPVGGAVFKAVQYQFYATDPATADPLVIDSNALTTFGGHLLLIGSEA